jgi:hypothetical protein
MLPLTNEQSALHQRALNLSREHRRVEWHLIEILEEIDRTKLFKRLGCSSLFQYAVQHLKLSEPIAYSFISVARKAQIAPRLREALKSETISVAKAARMVSALTAENSDDLVAFAETHSTRELDFEVARLNPKADSGDSARAMAGDRISLKMSVSKRVFEDFKRAQMLLGGQSAKLPDFEATLEKLVTRFLEQKDPLRKARRAVARRAPAKSTVLCARRVGGGRIPLIAAEKHDANARDGAQCTFEDVEGTRCTNERWLHLHHIKPVSKGGLNDAENLTTLCSYHHDLVHQLNFQIDWVKSRAVAYGKASRPTRGFQ